MNRLTLEPVDRRHAGKMFTVLSDPALYQFTGGQPPENVDVVREWFSRLETRQSPDGTEQWLTWIVRLKKESAPIGYVQATINGVRADIAWLIGTDWQGCGYAKEAVSLLRPLLKEFKVEILTAHIHPNHKASQRVATSLGLQHTGTHEEGEDVWVLTPRFS